jgi:sugar lactone lactonase YvrE
MSRLRWQSVVSLLLVCGVTLAATGLALGRPFLRHTRGAAAREQTFRAHLRSSYLRSLRRAHASGAASAFNGSVPDSDLADEMAQYNNERTAPAASVSGAALASAAQQAAAMGSVGGPWQDVTTQPYNAQPSNYTDPFWSNVGAGFSLVGGRTTALAQTPDGTWYAGTADGGVWRSTNQGATWTPIFDGMPTLSIGALAVAPDGSLWVGTGEANTNADSYAGTGVYRLDPVTGRFGLVGGDDYMTNPLVSHTIYQIVFDSSGDAYAATDQGLYRYDAGSGNWTAVLQPAGTNINPPYDQQDTTVQVVPGTAGRDVVTAIGWRGPGHTEYNGFYASTDGGHTFTKVVPTGDINASDIGRTTFAYSADASKLYAIVESPSELASGAISNLQGIFVSNGSNGQPASVAGPWTLVGSVDKLSNSGSANAYGPDSVGAQSWYNQDLAVDPTNPDHVYAGLEEVFESTDGGQNWVTASPYWNYGLACGSSCPNTTHPDQHSMMIADGKIVIGNDGGVYSRPLSDTQQYGDWSDLNATLASWQYYDARAGLLPGPGGPRGRGSAPSGPGGPPSGPGGMAHGPGGMAPGAGLGVWGGLQDNGTSVLDSGQSQMAEPAGGDGFYVVVDPANANNAVGEYTDGTEYSTTDGGHTFNDYVSPTCSAQAIVGLTPRTNCDPNARFATPLIQDQQNADTWVTGGQYVWITKAGWNTTCDDTTCSWQQVFDTGAGNDITALSSARDGAIVYAAWVSGAGEPGPTFTRGIATNYGGTWHELNVSSLPNRYIAGVTVDPANPAHAYAIFNGYSRRWIPGGGIGHVFETTDGGQTWQDISTNLPDIASDALVIKDHRLALATDSGMYTAIAGQGARTDWRRLGQGLPNASVNDVTLGPDGYIYAATHGRGIWRLPF